MFPYQPLLHTHKMPASILPSGFEEEEGVPVGWLAAIALFNYDELTVEIPPQKMNLAEFIDPRDSLVILAAADASITEIEIPESDEESDEVSTPDPLNTAVDYGSGEED